MLRSEAAYRRSARCCANSETHTSVGVSESETNVSENVEFQWISYILIWLHTPNGYFRRDHQELLLGANPADLPWHQSSIAARPVPTTNGGDGYVHFGDMLTLRSVGKLKNCRCTRLDKDGQGELSKNCILGCFILGPWQRPHSFGGLWLVWIGYPWLSHSILWLINVDHEFPHWLALNWDIPMWSPLMFWQACTRGLLQVDAAETTAPCFWHELDAWTPWVWREKHQRKIGNITHLQWEYRGFHSHGGTPIAGWFITKTPTKMDDLGVPPFQDTSIWR